MEQDGRGHLDGRVAIVTGAGKGLGRAFALDLAAHGARVVVNNRNRVVDADGRGPADHVVAEIEAAGGQAVADHGDVDDPAAGAAMVQLALDTWGRVDAVVTSAGISQPAVMHRTTLADFSHVIDVNLHGTASVVMHALRAMREAGGGRLVLVASTGGLHGEPTVPAYAASKGAVIALGRTLAVEARRHGVVTNVVLPYATTQMTDDGMPTELRDQMDPALVAPVVTALVDDRSPIEGQVLVVGGGGLRVARAVEGATVRLPQGTLEPEALAALVDESGASLPPGFPTAQEAFASLVEDLAG